MRPLFFVSSFLAFGIGKVESCFANNPAPAPMSNPAPPPPKPPAPLPPQDVISLPVNSKPENELVVEPEGDNKHITVANNQCGFAGNAGKNKDFPWQVSLSIKEAGKTTICGGTIIDKSWVVTAAHCLTVGADVTVKIGNSTEVRAAKTYQHSGYNDNTSRHFDIAVVRLERPITFNDSVRPICIPKECSAACPGAKNTAVISGKGLGQIDVITVSNSTCEQGFKTNGVIKKIRPHMLCASSGTGAEKTCKQIDGDSLSCKTVEEQYFLTGVKSFVEKCGSEGVYTVYTSPCALIDWLSSTTGLSFEDPIQPESTTTKATTTKARGEASSSRPSTTTTTSAPETSSWRWRNHQLCGTSKYLNTADAAGRVVGGQSAQLNEFPWQARIITSYLGNSKLCGGTIIGANWILTAAHCVAGTGIAQGSTHTVILGSHYFNSDEPETGVVQRQAAMVRVHERYRNTGRDYDIALIRLAKPLTYTDKIRPLCMLNRRCTNGFEPGSNCVISGWGLTKEGNLTSTAQTLQKAQVKLISNDDCKEALKTANKTVNLKDKLCAGHAEGGIDTCQGDSGGPLFCLRIDEETNVSRYYLQGVTSYGFGCGQQGVYGIYAKPCHSEIMDWIIKIIYRNETL